MDIKIEAAEKELLICKICNKECISKMSLPAHVTGAHKVEFTSYLVQYYLAGNRPKCPVCNEDTRYNRGKYSFKKYCIAHSKEAQKEWSRLNGFGKKVDAGWKRGLTKETSESIKKHSEKMKGENNPFYGKKHTGEIAQRLSASRAITSRISEDEFDSRKNSDKAICLTPYFDYTGLTDKNLKYRCTECERIFLASLQYNKCNPCTRKRIAADEVIVKKIADALKYSEEEFLQRTATRLDDFEILTPYSEYKNHDIDKLSVKCLHCNNIMQRTLFALTSGSLCKICSPFSKEEKEINEFLEAHGIKPLRNSREIIKPKELDFFIADKKFAIEYNGLFWHMENNKNKNYHSDKTNACLSLGHQLFHIFSDEWQDKKYIVKSMLLNRLGLAQNKIYARNCTIHDTNRQNILEEFTNATHISGHVQYNHAFYLKHGDDIVCALTLRKPFHKKYSNMLEIARFSSSLNTNIVGGFSRLFSYVRQWAKQQGYIGILSYADLRFGEGKVYLHSGFQLKGKTDIDYWYTDGKQRYNRFQYRATPGKTEKEVADEAGVQRIYGCGSNIYEYSLT